MKQWGANINPSILEFKNVSAGKVQSLHLINQDKKSLKLEIP